MHAGWAAGAQPSQQPQQAVAAGPLGGQQPDANMFAVARAPSAAGWQAAPVPQPLTTNATYRPPALPAVSGMSTVSAPSYPKFRPPLLANSAAGSQGALSPQRSPLYAEVRPAALPAVSGMSIAMSGASGARALQPQTLAPTAATQATAAMSGLPRAGMAAIGTQVRVRSCQCCSALNYACVLLVACF